MWFVLESIVNSNHKTLSLFCTAFQFDAVVSFYTWIIFPQQILIWIEQQISNGGYKIFYNIWIHLAIEDPLTEINYLSKVNDAWKIFLQHLQIFNYYK